MSWDELQAILEERRAELDFDRSSDPVACPNDGEPLLADRHGLYCPYDGWRPIPVRFADTGSAQYGSYDPPPADVPFNQGSTGGATAESGYREDYDDGY